MNDCSKFDNPEEDLGYLIWRITKYWQRGKHRMLDEFGLTGSQMEVLGAIFHLSKDEKEVTQIFLSQETGIDPMTVSTILRNLQKKGLITRKESKIDTRARVVELTEEGRSLFAMALTKVKELQEVLFESIDVDALRKQLKILLNELNRLSIHSIN
ncbi:MarR family winged helix-turn-helix transcriptional regulator [Dysgonomonas macrotermitis]|uniref:HTH-type transcriptional regulator SarZ n=2 Tax=Dysgonomonas macrotermitis TaxID=1346286 RepID=A0A1M4YIJ9_9BACT|nr:MarR family winged helix-turn-helix transcriptional regulator [Dysgonomonas macrotermitis]SHF05520.1 transcriptional regulator, MarR family [Dysgonomonas macrotermitis]